MASIETERLVLRQWVDSDLQAFAEMNADPQVMEFFPSTKSPEESAASAGRIRAQIEERGWGLWAAQLKETGEFIGFVGLQPVPDDLPPAPAVEIGWRLAVSYWGRGLATEAARSVVDYAFGVLGLDEIVSFTAEVNMRSRRVMERLGMEADPIRFEHPRIEPGSVLRTHIVYRLKRSPA